MSYLDTLSSGSGGMADVAQLVRLNDILRKAGAGYQTAAGTVGGDAGNFAPLIPQSIESMVAVADFGMDDIVFWNDFDKIHVSNTLHEWTTVNRHGDDLDPWLAEGGSGVETVSEFVRDNVRIKFLAEKRSVSDVATQVGFVDGVDRGALNLQTTEGTMSLFRKLEVNLFHGDQALTPLAFDGVYKQIRVGAPTNHTDLLGKAPQIQVIQDAVMRLISAPLFGAPDCLYLTPTCYGELVKQMENKGRFSMVRMASALEIEYGAQAISIAAPGLKGGIMLRSAPFIAQNELSAGFPLSAVGGTAQNPVPILPVLTSVVVGASAISKFVAGTYSYAILAMGDGGSSASLENFGATDPALDNVAVAAGQNVTITIGADGSAAAQKRYIRIYRTKNGGSSASGVYYLIARVPVVSGVATVFVDENNSIPDTSKMIMTKRGHPEYMQFVRLLDLIRRPVSDQGTTTRPFLIMLFGSPVVKLPTKCWTFDNCGKNLALGV